MLLVNWSLITHESWVGDVPFPSVLTSTYPSRDDFTDFQLFLTIKQSDKEKKGKVKTGRLESFREIKNFYKQELILPSRISNFF